MQMEGKQFTQATLPCYCDDNTCSYISFIVSELQHPHTPQIYIHTPQIYMHTHAHVKKIYMHTHVHVQCTHSHYMHAHIHTHTHARTHTHTLTYHTHTLTPHTNTHTHTTRTHSTEVVIKKLEKTVNVLIQESAEACAMRDFETVCGCVWLCVCGCGGEL